MSIGISQSQVTVGGQASESAPQHFFFTQSSALATWVIVHNLNTIPLNVVVMDSTNTEVQVEVHFDSPNQVTLLFSAPESGQATISV